MSKFNEKATDVRGKPDTTNLAGGPAFTLGAKMAIVTILLTTFLKDKFYEKADATLQRLQELINKLSDPNDIRFVAKAIVYARTIFGMRSITHAATVMLTPKIVAATKDANAFMRANGTREWLGTRTARNFFRSVIHRPDDMTEILSYLKITQPMTRKKSGLIGVPNIGSMRKGFADAFKSFSSYQLAKYRSDDKAIKLVDVLNWCHPTRGENAEALAALAKGELKSDETWEAGLSAAGKDHIKKADVWQKLLQERKLGYLALLRNLRNIMDRAPDVLPMALEALTSETFIAKSLILPFQYVTAYEEMQKVSNSLSRIIMTALSKAVDISLANVPKFEGRTLVVVDNSQSMTQGKCGNQSTASIAALFATVIAKANNADIMTFGTGAQYRNYNLLDSTMTTAKSFLFNEGGTNFYAIFQTASKPYDRIIILSDMQGWLNPHVDGRALNQQVQLYKNKYGVNPHIYSFDLAGYGTLQVREDRTYLLAGFSNQTMNILQYLEKDKQALLTEIEKIEL